MRPVLPEHGKTTPQESTTPEVVESPLVAEEIDDTAAASSAPDEGIEPPTAPRIVLERSPFKARPNADLVLAHLKDPKGRYALGKAINRRGGQRVWDLLVESIRSGAFGPPSDRAVRTPTLRMIRRMPLAFPIASIS